MSPPHRISKITHQYMHKHPPLTPNYPRVGFVCMGGHLNTQKQLFLSKFRFLSEFRVCLNWGRVQTCPSRSGRFTTCTIFLSAGRTRRSGFFLVQIVLKVRLFLRSAFHLFPHLPKKKKQQARSQQSWRVRSSPSSMMSSTIPSFGPIMGLA